MNNRVKALKIKQRQAQRNRLAKTIKHVRQVEKGQLKTDLISSLLMRASNYLKIK